MIMNEGSVLEGSTCVVLWSIWSELPVVTKECSCLCNIVGQTVRQVKYVEKKTLHPLTVLNYNGLTAP